MRITRAGFPPANENEGISFTTTDPAGIMLPSPIVTPGNIIEFAPTQTESSIVNGFALPVVFILCSILSKERSCPLPSNI